MEILKLNYDFEFQNIKTAINEADFIGMFF